MADARLGRDPHPARIGTVVLRTDTGEVLALDPARWHGPATEEEQDVLAGVDGPVIDLGCGPGRLVVSLADQRISALGVDSCPSAIALARRRGASVLERDILGPLPGEGQWGTALLFDGNIGIGGDPVRLLARCRRLIGAHGRVVVEVEPPGTGWRRVRAWFERHDHRGSSFDWAVVGADAIVDVAAAAALGVAALAPTGSGRWFAHLEAAVP